jgi:hypothetical protein
LLCLSVLVVFGLVVGGTAGAATITSWIGGKGATPAIVTSGGGACPPTMITVNGSGFVSDGGVPSVTIGGVRSPEVIVGSNIILYARMGAGVTAGSVVVTTPAGSVTATPAINVVPCQSTGVAEGKPTITQTTPKAKAGKKIQLFGSGFVGTTSVKVSGLTTNYAIPSDGVMYVIMPADAKVGVVNVTVTNTHGTATAQVVKIA